jgi:mono/diheme cytochrome c family protein
MASDAHGHDHSHDHGHDHGHGDGHHEPHRPVAFYLGIAVFLSLVTAVELGPLFGYYRLPPLVLLLLSAAKFSTVVAFFMHLYDDAPVFTRLFAAPLIGATLMISVLMVLAHTFAPSPGKDSFAVEERYSDVWNKDCSSWLRSNHGNRWYCASPPIADARVQLTTRTDDRPKSAFGKGADAGVDLSAMSEADRKAWLMKRGGEVYGQICIACHQENGLGLPPNFPPLGKSDSELFTDKTNHARTIVKGFSGTLVVNGVQYSGAMPAQGGTLSDLEIAAVATYERNSFGNDLGIVLPEDVKAVR